HAILELEGNPARSVAKLNRAIVARSPADRFTTFFLAVYDPATSTLTYCNAGHNPPLLLRRDGTLERLMEGGTVLGLFAAAQFKEVVTPFEPGDVLVMYSDGVVEAASSDDEQFGEERLESIIRNNARLNLPRVIETVVEALRAWSGDGGFADDVTI